MSHAVSAKQAATELEATMLPDTVQTWYTAELHSKVFKGICTLDKFMQVHFAKVLDYSEETDTKSNLNLQTIQHAMHVVFSILQQHDLLLLDDDRAFKSCSFDGLIVICQLFWREASHLQCIALGHVRS